MREQDKDNIGYFMWVFSDNWFTPRFIQMSMWSWGHFMSKSHIIDIMDELVLERQNKLAQRFIKDERGRYKCTNDSYSD